MHDLEDRFLAIAELDGNAQPYFPLSRIGQAREQRARAPLRRLEQKAVRITAAAPPAPIEGRRKIAALVDRLAKASCGQKAAPGEGRQRIWDALRSRSAAWSTPELVMTTGAEKRSVNLYVAALVQAGYVEIVSPAGPGDAEPAYYRLARNTGPRAPVRRRDGTIFDRNSEESAAPKAKPRLVAIG